MKYSQPQPTRPTTGGIQPPPPSLCPLCSQIEGDAKTYTCPDGRRKVAYTCSKAHRWEVRWVEVA